MQMKATIPFGDTKSLRHFENMAANGQIVGLTMKRGDGCYEIEYQECPECSVIGPRACSEHGLESPVASHPVPEPSNAVPLVKMPKKVVYDDLKLCPACDYPISGDEECALCAKLARFRSHQAETLAEARQQEYDRDSVRLPHND